MFIKLGLFLLIVIGMNNSTAANSLFPEGSYSGICLYQINTTPPMTCNSLLNIQRSEKSGNTFLTFEELICANYQQLSMSIFSFTDATHVGWLGPSNQKYGEGICENGECNLTCNNGTVAATRKMTFNNNIITLYQSTNWLQIPHKTILDCKYQINSKKI